MIGNRSGNQARETFSQFHLVARTADTNLATALRTSADHKRIVAHHIAVDCLRERHHAHTEVLRIQTWVGSIDIILIAILIFLIHAIIQRLRC